MNNNIPQGYKDSPLGVIPKDWEVRRLGEIAHLTSGATPLRSNNLYFDGGIIPWIKTTDLNNSTLNKSEECVTNKALDETSIKILPKGTVLVAMYGGFNQIGRTALLGIDSTINQALCALLLNKSIALPKYVLYWLNAKVALWRNFAASSRKDPNITSKDVSHFPIVIPPLAEQERIAEVLGTWDVAIEKQGALVDALTRRKRALMQQLLTARKRLPNFSAPWQEVELGELLDYEQPTKYLVKSTEYDNSYTTPVLTAGKTFILGYTDEEFGVCEKLPVILFDDFTTASKFVGFKFKVKSSAAKLLYAKGDYDIRFVFEAMQNIRYIVGGHERHWISKFAYITILIPTIEEQKAIAQILTTADKEIELATTKLNSLRTQKRALMQQLLTGKKRLRIWHNK
ncbi:MAG: restriction endonuclease subunit S [Rikenellaceae bacterium]